MSDAKDIKPVKLLEPGYAQVLLLEYLARGDRDFRGGRAMSDAEADRHFRAHLAKLDGGLG